MLRSCYVAFRKILWVAKYNARIYAEHTVIVLKNIVDEMIGRKMLIEAYGDSTTEGAIFDGKYVGVFPEQSEPWQLNEILNESYGIPVIVSNYGIGGTQAIDLINGSCGFRGTWKSKMKMSKAEIVLINFGHNDYMFKERPEEGRSITELHDFELNIELLCLIATRYGKIPILQEPNPARPWGDVSPLVPYVDAINKVASRTGAKVVQQFYRLQGIDGWVEMLSDVVHPGAEMYRLKAEETARAIAEIARAKSSRTLPRLRMTALRRVRSLLELLSPDK